MKLNKKNILLFMIILLVGCGKRDNPFSAVRKDVSFDISLYNLNGSHFDSNDKSLWFSMRFLLNDSTLESDAFVSTTGYYPENKDAYQTDIERYRQSYVSATNEPFQFSKYFDVYSMIDFTDNLRPQLKSIKFLKYDYYGGYTQPVIQLEVIDGPSYSSNDFYIPIYTTLYGYDVYGNVSAPYKKLVKYCNVRIGFTYMISEFYETDSSEVVSIVNHNNTNYYTINVILSFEIYEELKQKYGAGVAFMVTSINMYDLNNNNGNYFYDGSQFVNSYDSNDKVSGGPIYIEVK